MNERREAVNAILDGEIVALDPRDAVFGVRSGRKARPYVIVFQAFNLLYLDGAGAKRRLRAPGN